MAFALKTERRVVRIVAASLVSISLPGFAAICPSDAYARVAQGGGGGQEHHFLFKLKGSGSFTADYGEDRKAPGVTTAAGVDGQESMSFRWQIKSAATNVGDGPVRSTASIYRGESVGSYSLVSYTVQMGQVNESPLCEGVRSRVYTTRDEEQGGARAGGDWIYDDFGAVGPELVGYSFTARALSVEGNTCLHSPAGHGLKYYLEIERRQAEIPRGAFNPASDRSYRDTYPDTAVVDRDHSGDPNSAHTFQGESEVTVKIKAITEKKWRRKDSSYSDKPKGDIWESD